MQFCHLANKAAQCTSLEKAVKQASRGLSAIAELLVLLLMQPYANDSNVRSTGCLCVFRDMHQIDYHT